MPHIPAQAATTTVTSRYTSLRIAALRHREAATPAHLRGLESASGASCQTRTTCSALRGSWRTGSTGTCSRCDRQICPRDPMLEERLPAANKQMAYPAGACSTTQKAGLLQITSAFAVRMFVGRITGTDAYRCQIVVLLFNLGHRERERDVLDILPPGRDPDPNGTHGMLRPSQALNVSLQRMKALQLKVIMGLQVQAKSMISSLAADASERLLYQCVSWGDHPCQTCKDAVCL